MIVNGNNQPAHFWASTNGPGSYYTNSGPGALYYSVAAAQAAGSLSNFSAMVQNGQHQEWGNTTYQDANGVYSFTESQVIGPPCDEGQGCQGEQTLEVPDGTLLVGVQHSHPWVGGWGQFDDDVEQLKTGGYTFLDYVTCPSSNGPNWGTGPRTFVLNPNVPSVCQLSRPTQFGIQGCN
jgi:hypothetical protein